MVSFPESTIPQNAEFGIRVSGDSMEPVYQDGQIVWVQACQSLQPGEVGIFLYDGDGYVKRYEEQEPEEAIRDAFVDSSGVLHPQPVLVSYNQKYAPKPVSSELAFSIVGRVLN
jgi:phage repressor protein C with HTH and peptisase S24 domain